MATDNVSHGVVQGKSADNLDRTSAVLPAPVEIEFKGKEFLQIETPRFFSLIRGSREQILASLEFLHLLERCLHQNPRIMLDMRQMRGFSTDATLAMRSKLVGNAEPWAMRPTRQRVYEKMVDSGLFGDDAHVGADGKTKLPKGRIRNNEGEAWRRDANEKIVPIAARELVHFATRQLYGREFEMDGVYGSLVELMSNTRQHASEKSGHEVWWASVYYNEKLRNVRFNFIDNGIGILHRIRLAYETRYKDEEGYVCHSVRWESDEDLLQAVLTHQVPCLKPGKNGGDGLPDISRCDSSGFIRNLVIITNETIGRKRENEYINVGTSFSGTFVHFEIGLRQRRHCAPKC